MSESSKTWGSVAVIVLIAAGAIWYYEKNYRKEKELSLNDGVKATGEYVVEEIKIPAAPSVPAPSLNRAVSYGAGFPADAQAIVSSNIATLVTALKKNPSDLSSWVELGIQYKIAGDYEGARMAWEYVKALAPADSVAPNNLGDLYHLYIKNYSKAEENFLLAIKNKPDFISAYRSLYELYRYSYVAKAGQAPVILLRGIEKNPTAYDLVVLLAAYYKEKGDTFHALEYYKKAKGIAETAGNASLAAALQQEIDALQ